MRTGQNLNRPEKMAEMTLDGIEKGGFYANTVLLLLGLIYVQNQWSRYSFNYLYAVSYDDDDVDLRPCAARTHARTQRGGDGERGPDRERGSDIKTASERERERKRARGREGGRERGAAVHSEPLQLPRPPPTAPPPPPPRAGKAPCREGAVVQKLHRIDPCSVSGSPLRPGSQVREGQVQADLDLVREGQQGPAHAAHRPHADRRVGDILRLISWG